MISSGESDDVTDFRADSRRERYLLNRGTAMRILVTGGTGLLGRCLTNQLLLRGEQVYVVSRGKNAPHPGVVSITADISLPQQVRAAFDIAQPDRVVHLASSLQFACNSNPSDAVKVNVDGLLAVLEECRLNRIKRVVYGSSIAVYGDTRSAVCETTRASELNLYGLTKLLGESLGERFGALYGFEFLALRLAGIFGPGNVGGQGMAAIRQRLINCIDGIDMRIDEASGEETSHLTYVSDAAEALTLALTGPKPLHSVYNVAGPDENFTTLKEFHASIRALVPTAGNIIWGKHAKDVGHVDSTRFRTEYGFNPKTSVRDGIRMTIDAMKNTNNGSQSVSPPD